MKLSKFSTEFGRLNVVVDEDEIVVASFWEDLYPKGWQIYDIPECLSENACRWHDLLLGIIDGQSYSEIPCYRIEGTPFQLGVWKASMEVGSGDTANYKDIAVSIGRPKACRAVAQALASNPLAIFVPCHRITASDSLGGYRGGVERKLALLSREGAIL